MIELVPEQTGREAVATAGVLMEERNRLPQIRILLVEDEPLYAKIVLRRLKDATSADVRPVHVDSLGDAISHLSMGMTDLVLLDLMLPDSGGIQTLERVREAAPSVPVVVLTGQGAQDLAMDAIQRGAQDYLTKGSDEALMVRSVLYSLERSRAAAALNESEKKLRSTQVQLLQIDKLDSVGRLAAGIAHEVRNPLSTIQMGIAFMRDFCPNLEDDARETLDDMSGAMERAYGIIKGLLDFCVPTQLNLEECSLNRCVCQIMPMVGHEMRNRKVEFKPCLDSCLPPLMLDPNQIKQVLLHLVLNGIDAMDEGGGVLTVSTRVEELPDPEQRQTGGVVLLEVIDEGMGLVAGSQERIYEPFFTTKPTGSGTGLGLSISKNIVEMHGGRLDIVNRPEGGVRATVTFVA